jgi:uncharacterized protein YxeA
MKKKLLVLVLALTSISAFAGKNTPIQQENLLYKPNNSYQSIQSEATKVSKSACTNTCNFQFQICKAHYPFRNCIVQYEKCLDACF